MLHKKENDEIELLINHILPAKKSKLWNKKCL